MIEVRFVRKCIWVFKNSSRPLTFNPKDIKSFEEFEAKEMIRTGYAVKVVKLETNVDDLSSHDSAPDMNTEVTPERLRELYSRVPRTELQRIGKENGIKLAGNMKTTAMAEKLVTEIKEHDISFLEKINGIE